MNSSRGCHCTKIKVWPLVRDPFGPNGDRRWLFLVRGGVILVSWSWR